MTDVWMKIGVAVGSLLIAYVLGYIRGHGDAIDQRKPEGSHDAS